MKNVAKKRDESSNGPTASEKALAAFLDRDEGDEWAAWLRGHIEELYFGAEEILGETAKISAEQIAILARLEHEYVKAIEAVRVFERMLSQARDGSKAG